MTAPAMAGAAAYSWARYSPEPGCPWSTCTADRRYRNDVAWSYGPHWRRSRQQPSPKHRPIPPLWQRRSRSPGPVWRQRPRPRPHRPMPRPKAVAGKGHWGPFPVVAGQNPCRSGFQPGIGRKVFQVRALPGRWGLRERLRIQLVIGQGPGR